MHTPDHKPIHSVSEVLRDLLAKRELSSDAMTSTMEAVLDGQRDDTEVAAWLIALRMKGETAGELSAAAAVLRSRMTRFETGRLGVLDTCGMGGDGKCTFNISTATALVAAACGVAVVKHGNRAVSGHSGSTDVLSALGVKIDGDAASARRCLDEAGLAFCFAPLYHPALARLAQLRRRLGVRTMFNLLGPLANPAGAEYQLLGVAGPELVDPLAGALARLGTKHALLVSGADGLDEVSLSATTAVREVRGSRVIAHTWSPEDLGLQRCTLAELRAETPEQSARIIRRLLDGEEGPPLRIVLANTAAALIAAERVVTLREGVELARTAVMDGSARRVLDRLKACTMAA